MHFPSLHLVRVLLPVTMLVGACADSPIEPASSVAELSSHTVVASGEIYVRTLHGCVFTYRGSRNLFAPVARSQVRLDLESASSNCTLSLEAYNIPYFTHRSGATSIAGGRRDLVLTVDENTFASERSGTITILARTPRGNVNFLTIQLTQAAAPPPPPPSCNWQSTSDAFGEIPQGGGSISFVITAEPGCDGATVIQEINSPAYPGGMTATVTTLGPATALVTVSAPVNPTTVVRRAVVRPQRANYPADRGELYVYQRGLPASYTPRLSGAFSLSGAQQNQPFTVTSNAGSCWYAFMDPASGISLPGWPNPITACTSASPWLTTFSNTSGKARRTVLYLKSTDGWVVWDYAFVTQASL